MKFKEQLEKALEEKKKVPEKRQAVVEFSIPEFKNIESGLKATSDKLDKLGSQDKENTNKIRDTIDKLGIALKAIRDEIRNTKPLGKVKVTNFPDKVSLKKPDWYKKADPKEISAPIEKAIKDVAKQEAGRVGRVHITNQDPEDAIAVKLTTRDGSKFYEVVTAAISTVRSVFPFINTTGHKQEALVDASGHVQVDILTGGGAGTEYDIQDVQGAVDTGKVALVVRNDVLADLSGGDGAYAPLQVNASGAVYVDGSGVTQPISGSVTADLGLNNDVTIDNSSVVHAEDVQHSTGDDGVMALAVENEDQADLSTGDKDYTPIAVTKEGNVIVKQEGTIAVTESSPISGFATSALQLADGHNVTIDNISSNEVFIRGSQSAGAPVDGEVVTIQGIASMTPVAVTESSPISGFATSAGQLADGHNVTVDNISTNEVFIRGGGTAGSATDGEVVAIQGIAGATAVIVSATNLDIRDLTSASDNVLAVVSDGTDTASVDAAVSDAVPDLDGVNLLGTHALLSARADVNTTVGITAENSTHNAVHVAISDGEGIANVDGSNQLTVVDGPGNTLLGTIDTDTGNISTFTQGAEVALELIDGAIIGPGEPTIDSYTHLAINLSAAANQVLVASAANKQVWVYGITYTCSVAGTVSFQDEDDTAITGIMDHAANSGISHSTSGNFAMPIWKLGTDKDLEVDVVTAAIDGWLDYAIVSV